MNADVRTIVGSCGLIRATTLSRRQLLTTIPMMALVIALVATLTLGCSSDSVTGDDDGSSLDSQSDAGDISVDFNMPDGDDVASDTSSDSIEDAPSEDTSDIDPWSPTLGEGCYGDSDCSRGELCVGANPATEQEGYCTFLDCVDHDDCAFGDDEVFCCSDFGQFRGCFREGPDTVCGDATGLQGDDCSTGGQSDCDGENATCILWYQDNFCAEICNTRDDDACGPDHWCYPTGGGSGLCIPQGDTEEQEPCGEDPESCDEGSLCAGAFGDEPGLYSYCVELCISNGQCPETHWCQLPPGQSLGTCIPIGDVGEWGSCAEDRWACEQDLYCLNENTRYAHCMKLCVRDADCESDFSCSFFSETAGVCMPDGDRQTGESCGDDPYACVDGAVCINAWSPGFDEDAYCSESCLADPTVCGDGFYCQDFEDQGSFCMPDGDGDHGDECSSALDCSSTSYCIYAEGDVPGLCAAGCSSSNECLDDEWCSNNGTDEGGVCLADGALDTGDSCEGDPFACPEGNICGGTPSICVVECTSDPTGCPEGMYCLEPNPPATRRYCLPYGDVSEGEPCDDPYECEQDSFCSFIDDEGNGVCSHGCESNADCPSEFFCFRSRGFSACVPEGEGTTGADCSSDRFVCAADHLCLYSDTSQAYCGLDCTGFSQRCGDDEVCRYLGWDISFCMPVGTGAVNSSCVADVNSCGAESVCLEAGTDDAFCAQLCTFDTDACDGDYTCFFYDSGLGVCVPPDFDGSKPPPGGRPL